MREQLERYQVWLYLLVILAGMTIGWMSLEQTRHWEALLWPALGVLLYTTFTQVPLIHLRSAFRDRRFLAALLTGNFILIPVVVGLLLWLLPDDPAIRLGVLLVLLVCDSPSSAFPCIHFQFSPSVRDNDHDDIYMPLKMISHGRRPH